MSNDPDLNEFRRLLKELRSALDRSDPKYTHVAVDKQLLDTLVKEGVEVAAGYEQGLADTYQLELATARADELEAGASRFVSVDPSFVA